jgi:hypothetical protein
MTRPSSGSVKFAGAELVGCDRIKAMLRSDPAAKAEMPELTNVRHVFVKAAARLNNRAENGYYEAFRNCQRAGSTSFLLMSNSKHRKPQR